MGVIDGDDQGDRQLERIEHTQQPGAGIERVGADLDAQVLERVRRDVSATHQLIDQAEVEFHLGLVAGHSEDDERRVASWRERHVEQRRLADPGFAGDDEERWRAGAGRVDGRPNRIHLLRPADAGGTGGHAQSVTSVVTGREAM